MKNFTRAGNLKATINSFDMPGVPSDYQEVLQDYLKGDARGSFQGELLAVGHDDIEPVIRMNRSRASILDSETYDLLFSEIMFEIDDNHKHWYSRYDESRTSGHSSINILNTAEFVRRVRHCRVQFTTSEELEKDSFVAFHDGDAWSTGQIKKIFIHERTTAPSRSPEDLRKNVTVKTYTVIEKFAELSSEDSQMDPFRQFVPFRTRLVCRRTGGGELVVVSLNRVISHIAVCPFQPLPDESSATNMLVAVMLDRVSEPECLDLSPMS